MQESHGSLEISSNVWVPHRWLKMPLKGKEAEGINAPLSNCPLGVTSILLSDTLLCAHASHWMPDDSLNPMLTTNLDHGLDELTCTSLNLSAFLNKQWRCC